MEMDLPIKSTEIDLEEYGRTRHLPLDYQEIIARGFHYFRYKNRQDPFFHNDKLPTLKRPEYYQLVGEMNLTNLNAPDYSFQDIIGFLNAVEKYQYECIKANTYECMNDYYVVKIDSKGVFNHNISRAFRRHEMH